MIKVKMRRRCQLVQDSSTMSVQEMRRCANISIIEPEQQQPGQEPQQEQDQEEQLGVQQWPDFLNQVWQHFRVDERRLVAYLDRNDGLSSLQQEHAPIYSLLQQTFPSLLGVLRQIAEAGLTFGACLPGPPSSPKARATQGAYYR